MKKNNKIKSIFAILIVAILGVTASFAHDSEFTGNDNSGSYYNTGCGGFNQGMMNQGYRYEMHNDMTNLFTNGTYEDLEDLRDKYNMPIMHWIDDEKDFDNFKNSNFNMMRR